MTLFEKLMGNQRIAKLKEVDQEKPWLMDNSCNTNAVLSPIQGWIYLHFLVSGLFFGFIDHVCPPCSLCHTIIDHYSGTKFVNFQMDKFSKKRS